MKTKIEELYPYNEETESVTLDEDELYDLFMSVDGVTEDIARELLSKIRNEIS